MKEKRGSLYLLTGLVIGAVLGLLTSIFIVPARYVDVAPSALKAVDREQYRALVARAYLVEADNGRAVARLALLADPRPADALVAQAEKEKRPGGDEHTSRALALLAAAVSQKQLLITPLPRIAAEAGGQATEPAPGEQETPTLLPPTRTPGATITPRPSPTPLPTQGAPYALIQQKEICEVEGRGSLIQVFVFNAADEGVPAVRVEVSITDGGVESYFTGFYPEISPGYADYAMVEGMTYNLRVGSTGQLVQNLSVPQCKNKDGEAFPGSIQLVFKQP